VICKKHIENFFVSPANNWANLLSGFGIAPHALAPLAHTKKPNMATQFAQSATLPLRRVCRFGEVTIAVMMLVQTSILSIGATGMFDWVGRVLLDAGASVAGLFVSRDRSEFDVISAMTAILLLAAILTLLVYGKSLVDYVRSGRRPRI